MSLLLPFAAIVAGLLILIWSSDRFVRGAATLAKRWGISQIIIGMVIIGFGTSLPEMLVSALSALKDCPEIAIGNAYGSNIANIALILGVSTLICPLVVHPLCLRRDLPSLTAATLLAGVVICDYIWGNSPEVSRTDALIMLAAFGGIMFWTARSGKDNLDTSADSEETAEPLWSVRRAVLWVFLGLALLLGGSYILVWGAVAVAKALGVSELVIGLTIVAVGTSLPELASAIAAARQRQPDLVIGNILGSNLFNTLVVVGIAGAVKPFPVSPEVLFRDYPLMLGLLLLLFLSCKSWRGRPGTISRRGGSLLLAVYIGYTLWLICTAGATVLIDNRTPEEFSAGHLPRAINLPYDTIGEHIAEKVPNKNQVIKMYCRSGRRTGIAKTTLEKLGYTRVENLGGMESAAKTLGVAVEKGE